MKANKTYPLQDVKKKEQDKYHPAPLLLLQLYINRT